MRSCRVSATMYTADARFVLTGSDDGNVRIWKARASDKLGVITARERAAMEYRESLKERWKMDAQVGKVSRCVISPGSASHIFGHLTGDARLSICRSRHIPKPVYKAAQLKRTMLDARRVKEERRRKHTRAGESKPAAERKKVVIAEQT